ncbi:phage tail tape measure protein [Escherichia coli]|nr:phage tail tape measure protein [Escherichia coli]EFC5099711.1 phage tail tape measure protein [Escherichia coli]EFH4428639.1 phage tail tape measure protein [Escherichia coli]
MLNQETAKAARTDSGYILRAPRRMRVADAVAQYMRVPMGAGNSVPWDPLVAPYVIEPMNCLASREYDAVIFVGPARTGKTIGLIDGWVIYNVICDPADMLIIQMTEEKAREHSKKRLARTFRVSPEVVSRLSPNKNDNNVYDRTFLAGNYLKIGWPSVNIMSSSDYKCVALTDYDRFPEDIDGEGDAFSLASKRTTTFMSSGMTLVESSPGRDVKDVKWRRTSPHEAPPTTGILSLYNRGDRRRWYWPCPHCGEYFQPCGDVVAGFRDIADPVLASEAAYIQCPSCSGRIMPEQKRELNGRGVWLRDGESINADGSRYGDPRRSRIASFWMEGPAAAYQTLSQLVYKLLTAEQEYETTGSEETLKTVINTDWGLPYLPRASMEQRKSELLEQRAEPVPSRSVPDGVNFLVATVDVQAGRHRRFVVQVTGYGSRGERWIMGDQQRQRYQVQLSLRQKYQQQLEQLRRDSEQKGTYNTDDYRKAEQALTESLNRQLNENRRYWQQLEVVQGNWKNGVLRAFQDFTVDADNTAETAEQVFSSAFSNMGNGLATFVTTGKLNFKSFTSSVLSDMAKILAQATMMKSIKGIGSVLGFDLSSLSLNANGGIYQSADLSRYSGTVVNRPTFFAFAKGAGVMGEAGPEAILPLRRGADGKLGVVADIGGSGMAMFSPQYNIEINNDGTNGQIGPAALKAVYDLGKKAAADFMQQQARDGGRLSGAYR